MRRLLREPPLFKTSQTPDNILGAHSELYERHYRTWQRNQEQPEKVDKVFSPQELETVSRINNELLEHGYRARRIDESGNVIFGIVTSLDVRVNKNKNSRPVAPEQAVKNCEIVRALLKEVKN